MSESPFSAGVLLLGLIVISTGLCSQSYPNKPIRIVTSAAGGGNDFVARLIAHGIAGPLGQPVIVDNRASGVIPGEIVARAQPDGYTMLVIGSSFMITPLLQSAPYDPVRDFSPITLISSSPNIVAVHPTLPVKTIQELIAAAKAKPGALDYASTAAGSGSHLAAELFKSMAGVNITRVNYKSTGSALGSLIGGEVKLMFPSASSVSGHIKSGKLNGLAVTSAKPSALAPGLPTVAAAGLPGYEVVSMDLIFVPAKTPLTVINRLNHEIVRVIKQTDVRDKFVNTGAEAIGSSAQEAAAAIVAEVALWTRVIKTSGIRAD